MDGQGNAMIEAPPGDHGVGSTMIVSGFVIALAVISVALRFYTRIFTRVGLGPDDWFILISVLATLAVGGLILWGNSVTPDGPWVSEIDDPDFVYQTRDLFYMQLSFASSLLYFTISGTTKLGILLMYFRLFSSSETFRWRLLIAGLMVLSWWLGCTAAALIECRPILRELRGPLIYPIFCNFNFNIFWMATGVCEILLDLLILALPVSFVLRMRLSPHQKVTVSGIFLLGAFIIITGIVKVTLGYSPGSRTPSYANTEVWAAVHTGMAIVCASLPILRPLAVRMTHFYYTKVLGRPSSVTSFTQSGDGTHDENGDEKPDASGSSGDESEKKENPSGNSTGGTTPPTSSEREGPEMAKAPPQPPSAAHLATPSEQPAGLKRAEGVSYEHPKQHLPPPQYAHPRQQPRYQRYQYEKELPPPPPPKPGQEERYAMSCRIETAQDIEASMTTRLTTLLDGSRMPPSPSHYSPV
ncbi:hypothetical protein GGS23DRAFT_264360 [Durotheca rogersii]|uniref:uncharacterized protein n=1 Tax=Durotheca rogersii TaxID=419775 RepID=UPI0022203E85|nr:uncharacterized protein GGS23DRAFT_264360 [Durotheca rogersii]KAI5859856.1 hypothetical protein GGS23DRAFT_264360 [Durotheca rogersii]